MLAIVVVMARVAHAEPCVDGEVHPFLEPSVWAAVASSSHLTDRQLGYGVRDEVGARIALCWGDRVHQLRIGATADLATVPAGPGGSVGAAIELDALVFDAGSLGVRFDLSRGNALAQLPTHFTSSEQLDLELGARLRLDSVKLGLDALYTPTSSGYGMVVSVGPTGYNGTVGGVVVGAIMLVMATAFLVSYDGE